MRPLELTVRNFRSFAGETRFDFRDRTLLGIVGPIGSGKSSILDAIAYALYARTPRVASSIRDLIHQRNDTAIVSLLFDVEGETWQATRSIRRSQSSHTLQHLDEEGAAVETLTQKSEVDARIAELIGLDFDGFSRSVLLAQGRFAEFLSAQPAQRDRVLKGVFGHERIDRMRQVAKERAAELSLDIEKISGRLEALASAELRLGEQRDEHALLAERLEALEKIKPSIDDLDEQLATTARRSEVVSQRSASVTRRLGELPHREDVTEIVAEVDRATGKRAELAAELAEQQQRLQEAEAELDSLSDEASVLDTAADLLTRRGGVLSQRDERRTRLQVAETATATLADTHERAMRRHAAARSDASAREETLAVAVGEEADARDALDRARHANMAHALRGRLVDGEPCPVCRQDVAELPPAGEATDLTEAEHAHESAVERLATARRQAEEARTELAAAAAAEQAATSQLEAARTEIEVLRADLEATLADLAVVDADLAGILGDGDPASLLKARREALESARGVADAARKALDRIRTAHDQSIRDEQTATKRLAEIRLAAARIASALDVEFEPATDTASGLADALQTLRAGLEEENQRLDEETLELAERRSRAEEERAARLASVDVNGDLATEITTVSARLGTIAQQIARVEQDLAAQADDRTRLATLETRRGWFTRIAADLTDAKFVRYLLDDERIRLGELASEHFQRLSSGRYRFTSDGTFAIVDLATADVERKADSLSGGETFLASLALALGLAEMVARSGGRLEAFFLDEGFGTLDPEHLGLAMEGIERLVTETSSRLVVVVSHVPELRLRIEDLIELDKHPLTGDSVVRGGATRGELTS